MSETNRTVRAELAIMPNKDLPACTCGNHSSEEVYLPAWAYIVAACYETPDGEPALHIHTDAWDTHPEELQRCLNGILDAMDAHGLLDRVLATYLMRRAQQDVKVARALGVNSAISIEYFDPPAQEGGN